MQKFLEGLKDFLYDSIDYIIMIGIVGLVVFIIGWRLDLLFADSEDLTLPKDNIIAEAEDSSYNKSPDPTVAENDENEQPGTENAADPIVEEEPTKEEPTKPVENTSNEKLLTINIPSGSSSSNVGSILESNGLISSKSDFIVKSEEMQLSGKLKAGNYEIQSGSSLEDILKILTK